MKIIRIWQRESEIQKGKKFEEKNVRQNYSKYIFEFQK